SGDDSAPALVAPGPLIARPFVARPFWGLAKPKWLDASNTATARLIRRHALFIDLSQCSSGIKKP
ncbi:MAG TPA: hypothetical protein VEH30_00385, partial [Terriglobales bacterium]|nr:hypothetical protein [Terriglobales bacterium]